MRIALVDPATNLVVNVVEAKVEPSLPLGQRNPIARVRAMFPGLDCMPLFGDDSAAAECGAVVVVARTLRWGSGRIRRLRFQRSDGHVTEHTWPDGDDP